MKTKEEILKGIIYQHGEGEDYCNVIFAMQEFADQSTAELKAENEMLKIKLIE